MAKRAFEMAAQAAQAAGDPAIEVEAQALVARCYFLDGNVEDGFLWLERAESQATPTEPMGYSRARQVRGLYERGQGDGDKALEIFEALYDYCRDEGLYERALDAAHHLALLAPLDGQVVWARRAIEAATTSGNEVMLAILWNNLGLTYERMMRPQESLASYRRARWYHYRTGNERDRLIADWAVGRALRLAEREDEALLWLQEVVQRAQKRWAKNPGADEMLWRGHALAEMGETLAALGHFPDALEALEKARLAYLGLSSGVLEEGIFSALLSRIEFVKNADRF